MPLTAGVWAAWFCLAEAIPDGSPLREVALLPLPLSAAAYAVWWRRKAGVTPRWRGAPAEIWALRVRYAIGFVALVGILAALWWLTAPWFAAIAGLVLVPAAEAWHRRASSKAADRVRARLG